MNAARKAPSIFSRSFSSAVKSRNAKTFAELPLRVYDCFPGGHSFFKTKAEKVFPDKKWQDKKITSLFSENMFQQEELVTWRNNLIDLMQESNDSHAKFTVGLITLALGEIKHLSLIMDGNRRWAQSKGLSVSQGHARGYEMTLPHLVEEIFASGVHTVSVWSLSRHNLLRADEEILNSIYPANMKMLDRILNVALESKARIFHAGSEECANPSEAVKQGFVDMLGKYKRVVAETRHMSKHGLVLCANYNGSDDVFRAVKKMSFHKVVPRNPNDFFKYTDLGNQPYPVPDVVIRTGTPPNCGKLSDFLYNMEKTRFLFTNTLFPELDIGEVYKLVANYAVPENRYISSAHTYKLI
jgi:undecaprenyl diphosphate synthase